LGSTICQSFYFPYAVKLWGVDPSKLDATAAHRRVSGSSIAKMIAKVLNQVPGFKKPQAGGFYYPRKGFRQISDAFRATSEDLGARYRLNHRVRQITPQPGGGFTIEAETDGVVVSHDCDYVWSSIPLTILANSIVAEKPAEVTHAISNVRYRSMILIYLVLEQQQFTEFDAHYFPEVEIPLSRLSEPKNYYASQEPSGLTVLCGELPCSTEDHYWRASDEELGRLMVRWLRNAALPVSAKVRKVHTRRLSHAYPIYDRDFAGKLDTLEAWVGSIDGLVTFGRQGLFAHDNTHHAFAMAKAATECLNEDGGWNKAAWANAREHFREHVVED
jgi:protoporphyrinogen oxidase